MGGRAEEEERERGTFLASLPPSLPPQSLFVQSGDRVRPEMSFGLHQPPSFTPLHRRSGYSAEILGNPLL